MSLWKMNNEELTCRNWCDFSFCKFFFEQNGLYHGKLHCPTDKLFVQKDLESFVEQVFILRNARGGGIWWESWSDTCRFCGMIMWWVSKKSVRGTLFCQKFILISLTFSWVFIEILKDFWYYYFNVYKLQKTLEDLDRSRYEQEWPYKASKDNK